MALLKDLSYRIWNAGHGGVYVPVTEDTQPNQYLRVPHRDVTTTTGKELTLINPAMMTRQVFTMSVDRYGIRGHITSLNVINPINVPDDWERKALQSFENTPSEVTEFMHMDGKLFMRFIRPMITEELCLKCHSEQGYKVGDIRGGISVSVPMKSFISDAKKTIWHLAFAHGVLLIVGIMSLLFSNRKVTQYLIASEESKNKEVKTKKRLQAITENVPGVVFQFYVSDTGETGIHYISPKLFDIFGLEFIDDPSLYLQAFVQNIHEEDRQSWMDSVQNAVQKQIPWNWKGRYVKPSGETLWFEGQSIPTVRKDEIVFDGIFIDITSIKILEEEKYQTEIQLHRAQKMEAIGMMAGGVAHDLNNILSGIVSYPELMLLKLPETSELRKPIKAIQDSGKRAATVVADLLTVARGAASIREPHNINLLVHEYLDSLEFKKLASLHPDVLCTKQLEAKYPTISCSPMHIKKAVMNLITNAAEAIGNKGNVIVSTCNRVVDKPIIVGQELEPGNYLVLTVQDNGKGITASDLEHIFEPFYTKKIMGRSGTGLGLAVVWNTVQDHNGKIFVKSRGKGTEFQLYFPVSEDEVIEWTENDQTEKLTGSYEHVLVVDDEVQLRDIASQILIAIGYRVDSVCSGELAIKFVKDNPVDLIVLDMLMEPGMNGYQTYKEILKLYPNQKAIIASGFSESDDVKEALRLGAGGFIKKPYSIVQLGSVVKEVLSS